MALSYISKVLSRGKYLALFLISAIVIEILYLGFFVYPSNFGEKGVLYLIFNWFFAFVMPILIGLIISIQIYNLKEVKTCPASATTGGFLGSLLSFATVACPACPAVLLGWLGLAGAISSAVLSSIWFKGLSLLLLIIALIFATKGQK